MSAKKEPTIAILIAVLMLLAQLNGWASSTGSTTKILAGVLLLARTSSFRDDLEPVKLLATFSGQSSF